MSFKTASAILRGTWLINRAFVHSNVDMILDLRKGKSVDFGMSEREEEELNKALTEQGISMAGNTRAYQVGMYSNLDEVAPGSIAIVNLFGPVLKFGDMCSYGMVEKAALLSRIAMSGNFKSIVLNVDSPGGQADGTQLLADTIKSIREKFGMTVIAVVDDGMMASAAMWIGSACDEIYATKGTDTFGSIGVYMTIVDFREYLKKMGVDMRSIYADQSIDKNKSYRDALDGDDALLKEDLNFLAEAFINAVTENRGDRLDTSKENPFTGKMYPAQKAMEIGLIDGILPFDEVLSRADQAGDDQSNLKNSNKMFGKNKFASLTALVGLAAAGVTAAHVDAVNTEIEAENIEGVTLVLDSELETATTAVTENGKALAAINTILGAGNEKENLTDALAAFTTAAAATTSSLTTVTNERDTWKGKAEEYGAKPDADATSTVKEGDDKIEETGNVGNFFSDADQQLADMKAAAGYTKKPAK